MPLWTTAHPLYNGIANIFGASISEATMRSNPRPGARACRAGCAGACTSREGSRGRRQARRAVAGGGRARSSAWRRAGRWSGLRSHRPRSWARSHFRFRKRGTKYVSKFCMNWMISITKRQCGRALPRSRSHESGASFCAESLRQGSGGFGNDCDGRWSGSRGTRGPPRRGPRTSKRPRSSGPRRRSVATGTSRIGSYAP